jgi:hypothetical protein
MLYFSQSAFPDFLIGSSVADAWHVLRLCTAPEQAHLHVSGNRHRPGVGGGTPTREEEIIRLAVKLHLGHCPCPAPRDSLRQTKNGAQRLNADKHARKAWEIGEG